MNAASGMLTPHGWQDMRQIGTYERQYFEQHGLLTKTSGCESAEHFYFRSDSIQRDIDSGRAIADAIFPGCGVKIHALTPGHQDPMFRSANTAGLFDRDAAAAWTEAQTHGDPLFVLKEHETETAIVQAILSGKGKPEKLLLSPVPPTGDRYSRATGANAAKSAITDGLLLDYEEGLPAADTGWGRLNPQNISALLLLHESLVDLIWDNPVVAKGRVSDLLSHIVKSLQQAVEKKPVEGSLGDPDDKALFIFGHDTDFGQLATVLHLTWKMKSFPPRATQPGAAMMFEIWREASGRRTVRVSVTGQTVDEIRAGTAPSVKSPPSKVAVFIPGCSTRAIGYPCEWRAFLKLMNWAIDPAQVVPEPADLN